MKEYEIIPRNWNKDHTDLEGDYDSTDYATTYREAVKIAKSMSERFDRADVQLNNKITDEDDPDMVLEVDHLWVESYEDRKQVPVVYVGDRPIWRWDFLDRDLKPRKK